MKENVGDIDLANLLGFRPSNFPVFVLAPQGDEATAEIEIQPLKAGGFSQVSPRSTPFCPRFRSTDADQDSCAVRWTPCTA